MAGPGPGRSPVHPDRFTPARWIATGCRCARPVNGDSPGPGPQSSIPAGGKSLHRLTQGQAEASSDEAGADEVNDLGEQFEIVSEPTDLVAVRSALQEEGIDYDSAELGFRASVEVEADAELARKVFKLIDALEDSDDVQNVYSNVDVSDDVLAELDA